MDRTSKLVVYLIIFLRVFSALLIVVSPLWGFLFFELVDYWDAHFFINVAKTKWDYYQRLDKRLDVFGFIAILIVSSKYGGLSLILYLLVFRLIGQLIYEITKKQWILIGFPNLVEVFYIWIVLLKSTNLYILSFLIVIKIIQECFLHIYWPSYLKRNGYPAFIKAFGVRNKINWG